MAEPLVKRHDDADGKLLDGRSPLYLAAEGGVSYITDFSGLHR